jgi:signal transduction histidine kinase
VVDNGLGLSSSSNSGGHGVGLSNIRQRIAMLFDEQASLSIKEQAAGGVVAQLKLPLSGQ